MENGQLGPTEGGAVLQASGIGFVDQTPGDPLDPPVAKSLPPLLQKLAAACLACLQNEELAKTHRRVEFEHSLLRAVIDNTPNIVFVIDREGMFTLSEGHGLQALGRKPGEVVGLSIFDYQFHTKET